MDTTDKIIWLAIYSAFFGVFFTSALAWGYELSDIGVLMAKTYALVTGPIWLLAVFRWDVENA